MRINKFIPKKISLLLSLFFAGFSLVLCNQACQSTKSEKPIESISNQAELIPETVDFIFHVKPILSDRCFKCHGPDEQKIKGNLQLHTEEKAFAAIGKNKNRFALIPNDVENSTLIQRIFTDNPDDIMPPPESNLDLSATEKAILKKWVAQGAKWKKHWSFIPPVKQKIPDVQNKNWVTNDIDNFILAKLEPLNIAPSPTTSKEKLIRRLSFDLRGLPPSTDDVQSFLNDDSEENYARIVDKFMTSDAFAERMTNEWLDLARYADTHGYQDDLERIMWPWRDWVIHAFKQNMPYDQFVEWQLAGDLLPNASKEQIIATAFNRNHKITQEGGVIPEEYRAEYVSDRTNTFATAFLGLTFECAKCHDHKYDPISQKEYFELFGYFNNVKEKGLIEAYGEIPEPYIEISQSEIEETLTFIKNLDTLENIPLLVMEELKEPRQTHILSRGLYDQPSTPVEPSVPSFGEKRTESNLKNRLGLSNWLFNEENPLTSRVMVNRLWQQVFGQGIVATSYDFGNQGALPTHPELLDYLAVKFREEGWDIRKIMKYMVTSSTYKQDSRVSEKMVELDPENRLLARASRSRLSAEMLRDHALSISGLLVNKVGGRSVKPYQPEGLWKEVAGGGSGEMTSYVQGKGDENYRRSLYTFWKRTVPPPNMTLFDAPTRDFCTVQRENTSTPLQALVLLNDPQFLETSRALAYRALTESKDNVIEYMFQLATSRTANEEELATLNEMYQSELIYYQENPTAREAFLQYGNTGNQKVKDEAVLAAYSFVANAIFNLDETIRKS